MEENEADDFEGDDEDFEVVDHQEEGVANIFDLLKDNLTFALSRKYLKCVIYRVVACICIVPLRL